MFRLSILILVFMSGCAIETIRFEKKPVDYSDNSSLLLVRCATASVHVDLARTLEVQKRIGLKPGTSQLIVTNEPASGINVEQISDPPIGDGKQFNHSRARNFGIEFAIARESDWIVFLDSDSVWLGMNQSPPSGYGTTAIYFFRRNEPFHIPTEGYKLGSWFIMHRSIFAKPWCRFDERFVGYGYEDWDFNRNILGRNGIAASETDARALHLNHAVRSWPQHANKELFISKKHENRSPAKA